MKHIFLLIIFISASWLASAQSFITGKVLSAQNESPLPGVRITNTTGKTTLTNEEGIFKIECHPTDTVHFTKEGYASHTLTNSKQSIVNSPRILLQPLGSQLAEVVINTGYQPLPRERTTGAYSHIDAATLSQQVSTGILSRLETLAPGLSFDRSKAQGRTTILIRGLSSIQGPREPLIVVDNFVYSGDISNINPNDVEAVTILKDAAATSIWGARAGNGVIVITTKKGSYNKKIAVTLSSNISFTAAPDLYYLPSMAAKDVIATEQLLFANGYNFADTAADERPVFSPAYELMFRHRNGEFSNAVLQNKLDSLSRTDLREQFKKNLYRTAVNTQHNISINGGSNSIAWRFAAGLNDNNSELYSRYRRINITANTAYKLAKNIQLNTTLLYTNSYATAGRPGYNDISTWRGKLPVYTALVDAAGNPLPVMNTYRQPYIDTAGAGKLLNWNYSPITEYQNTNNKTYLQNITTAIDLQYKLTAQLALNLKYQYENQQSQNDIIYGEQTYMSRNLVNSFTRVDPLTGQTSYPIPQGAILDANTGSTVAQNARAQLAYNKNSAQYNIAALAGWEIRTAQTKNSRYRTYGYNPATVGFGNVNYLQLYPTYMSGAENFIPSNQNFDRLVNRFVSAFTNIGYSYKSRYHFTASMRRDASNLFGANTNDKWNLLWSAGLGWEISREKNYNLRWLPYLKLRSTYGKSGNIDPSVSAVSTISYFIVSPYTGTTNAILDKFKNPDLGWEQVSTWNSGIDFKTASGSISGSFDFYFKKGKNLYGLTPADYTAVPATRIIKNVAAMKGSGIDAEINSININRSWQWTTQLHFSTNTDKVTSYYLSNRQGSSFLNGGNNISAVEGRPVYALYSYPSAGLDPVNGNPLGYFNGQVGSNYAGITGATTTIDSLLYHGRALPAVFGALGNTFRYKNFYLTARLSYKLGYYIRKSTISYTALFNSNSTHSDYYQRWQQPGDEAHTSVPSMLYPADSRRDNFYANTASNIVKGDHLRFQFLNFGYEFNSSSFKKLPVKSLNLFCSISNIGILWRANKNNIDPDYGSDVIPPSTSWAVGFNINFK